MSSDIDTSRDKENPNPDQEPQCQQPSRPWKPSDPRIPSEFPPWEIWPTLYQEAGRIVPHEALTGYLEGGYHPVAIGDVFRDARYKVRYKLGYGAHSMVWLAEDLCHRRDQASGQRTGAEEASSSSTGRKKSVSRLSRELGRVDPEGTKWVALKIRTATASPSDPADDPEVRTLKLLERGFRESLVRPSTVQNGNIRYYSQLLDHFTIRGPNGIHLCLVLEFLGPCIWNVIDACTVYEDFIRPDTILRATRQLLTAVDMAHETGVAHGDISFSNVLFTCHGFLDNFHYTSSSCSESESEGSPAQSQNAPAPPDEEPKSVSTTSTSSLFETLGGSPDIAPYSSDSYPRPSFLPTQLVNAATWGAWVDRSVEDVRIIDWEQAFPVSTAVTAKALGQPLDLRCPETFFAGEIDHRIDLWRVGCVIYALFYQHLPFSISSFGSDTFFIQKLLQKIGPLPTSWQPTYDAMLAQESSKKPDSKKKPMDLPLPPKLITKTFEPRRKRIAEAFCGGSNDAGDDGDNIDTDEFGEYDLEALKCLLPIMQGLLRWEPEKRMGAKEALGLLDWVDYRREM